MATQSEKHRYEEERKHPSKAEAKRKKTGSRFNQSDDHKNKHAAKKATYALEEQTAEGAATSRKSTRRSANHARNDQGQIAKEAFEKGSPEAIHEHNAAKQIRSRGHSSTS